MDYFLLNAKTGELHTARPLDRESLPDAIGIITLKVRARELIDGIPANDNSTVAITQASITIHDVNDSPPTFNKKNYFVSLAENTPIGTPLPIEISARDPDVVSALSSLILQLSIQCKMLANHNLFIPKITQIVERFHKYRGKIPYSHYVWTMYLVYLMLSQNSLPVHRQSVYASPMVRLTMKTQINGNSLFW